MKKIVFALLALLVIAVVIVSSNADANRPDTGAEQGVAMATAKPSAPAQTPNPTMVPLASGAFELPLEGATGFATIAVNLRSAASAQSERLSSVPAGDAFRIIEEQGAYWRVEWAGQTGYVAHRYCLINLPDVIPSIIYDNTNASESRVVSSGKALPGITGEKLYDAKDYNARLGRDEFIMPLLYSMAKRVCEAQQAALAEGNSLKIYEAYRPHAVQRTIARALSDLADEDGDVRDGISAPPWKVSWFVSQGTSNHQRGCAIDVSLVRIDKMHPASSGNASYNAIAAYTEYEMPSPIHELSIASAAFRGPVQSGSVTAWKDAKPAAAMNEPALLLQRYCTQAGLTPLASEWWHFNDLASRATVSGEAGEGQRVFSSQISSIPGGAVT